MSGSLTFLREKECVMFTCLGSRTVYELELPLSSHQESGQLASISFCTWHDLSPLGLLSMNLGWFLLVPVFSKTTNY